MGLALLLANTGLSALMATLEQQLTKAVSQTAPGLIIYRFAASLPPLLALAFAFDDHAAPAWPSSWGDGVEWMLPVTALLSSAFGLAVIRLSQLGVRPTTILAANSSYKLFTTVLGVHLFPVPVPPRAWLGYAIAFAGYLAYALQPKPKAKSG